MIIKSKSISKDNENGLYLVSTPIGNLKDITFRAIEVLKKSSYILCEDTRVSKNLLDKYDIKSKLISNHKFNETKNLSKIIELLKSGEIVSLISDAGTPSISDPGAILVNECIKKNIKKIIDILKTQAIVSLISDAGTPTISDPGSILINECVNNKINLFPIPGPSAPIAALSISGFSNKFYFYGFFPENNSEIKKSFEVISKINGSIIFFISAKKFNRSINIIQKYFSDRKILICKEITKYYEEYFRFNVNELDQKDIHLKGEITLVLSEKKIANKTSNNLNESDKIKIRKLIKKLSIKEIVDLIKDGKNIPKKNIYNYCLKIKNEK